MTPVVTMALPVKSISQREEEIDDLVHMSDLLEKMFSKKESRIIRIQHIPPISGTRVSPTSLQLNSHRSISTGSLH